MIYFTSVGFALFWSKTLCDHCVIEMKQYDLLTDPTLVFINDQGHIDTNTTSKYFDYAREECCRRFSNQLTQF